MTKNKSSNVLLIVVSMFYLCIISLSSCARVVFHDASMNHPWRFIVISDPHSCYVSTDPYYQTTPLNIEIYNAIIQENPDFVAITGDLTSGYNTSGARGDSSAFSVPYSSKLALFKNTANILYDRFPIYVCRGNHDVNQDNSIASWQSAFSYLPSNGPEGEDKMTYYVDHKNVKLIFLDQYKGWVSHHNGPYNKDCPSLVDCEKINQNWFDSTMAANTRANVFVFSHQPVMSVSTSNLYDPCVKWLDVTTFINSMASSGRVRAYFCGHIHTGVIADINGGKYTVRQVVSGSSGGHPIPNPASSSYTCGSYSEHILWNSYDANRLVGLESLGYTVVDVSDETNTYAKVRITYKERTLVNGNYQFITKYSSYLK